MDPDPHWFGSPKSGSVLVMRIRPEKLPKLAKQPYFQPFKMLFYLRMYVLWSITYISTIFLYVLSVTARSYHDPDPDLLLVRLPGSGTPWKPERIHKTDKKFENITPFPLFQARWPNRCIPGTDETVRKLCTWTAGAVIGLPLANLQGSWLAFVSFVNKLP